MRSEAIERAEDGAETGPDREEAGGFFFRVGWKRSIRPDSVVLASFLAMGCLALANDRSLTRTAPYLTMVFINLAILSVFFVLGKDKILANPWCVSVNVATAVALCGVVLVLASMPRRCVGGNGASAISSLRTMVSSQAMFYQGDIDGDQTYDYATSLEQLSTEGLIDNVLGAGTKSGYVFVMTNTGGPHLAWQCTAAPLVPGSSGSRWFFVDESGVIRVSETGPASVSDEPLE